jgi:hypothetical protein
MPRCLIHPEISERKIQSSPFYLSAGDCLFLRDISEAVKKLTEFERLSLRGEQTDWKEDMEIPELMYAPLATRDTTESSLKINAIKKASSKLTIAAAVPLCEGNPDGASATLRSRSDPTAPPSNDSQ